MIAQDYVTEKLYDSVLAGAIPVYIGAANAASDGFIRSDCAVIVQELTAINVDQATASVTFDAAAVAHRIKQLLADPVALAAMKGCFPALPPDAAPVQRCLQVLSNPDVSEWAIQDVAPDGSTRRGVAMPTPLMISLKQTTNLVFCAACDAAWQHKMQQ